MNIKMLRLFLGFKDILPRYRVKLGDYYQLIGVTTNNKPYTVEEGMTKRVSDMHVEKNELAKVSTWEEFITKEESEYVKTYSKEQSS